MTTMVPELTWRPGRWLWTGLPVLAALALYAPIFPALVREWATFPSLSHGFAIPFIAAYLLWSRLDRLRGLAMEPSIAGLPILLLGLVALVIGIRGQESFLARISLPVTLLGLVIFLGGWRITRQAWPAIGYLVFMVPLPWATLKLLTYRSRLLDASVSAAALGWLGVPVHHDGVFLTLPNIVLEVADECSSIPAVAALLSLGVAYSSVVDRPLVARLIMIGATLPFAITANIIRITTTAAAAYYIGPWTLRTSYHMFNGTVNFLFTFCLLLALDALLGRCFARRTS